MVIEYYEKSGITKILFFDTFLKTDLTFFNFDSIPSDKIALQYAVQCLFPVAICVWWMFGLATGEARSFNFLFWTKSLDVMNLQVISFVFILKLESWTKLKQHDFKTYQDATWVSLWT